MKQSMTALCVLAGLLVSASGWADEARDASLLVGAKSCKMCHKKDETGNQAAKWEASSHAKAYATLATPEAKAAGAKVGVDNPQTSGKCLQCHSTAYNWTETRQTETVTLEEGVSCESCHGPGKNYKAMATMKSRDESVKAGMVYPATKSCVQCHNEKAPSWDPERYTSSDGKKVGFDVEQAQKKIEHPNPNVQK